MSALLTAIDGLRQMIISGEISPGDRFPNEVDLCEKLGVSRSSLREAVQALSALGVLESQQGSGRYVSDLDPSTIINGFRLTIDLVSLDGLLQFMDVRRVLEAHASSIAAIEMGPEDRETLVELLTLMESAESLPEFQDYDNLFHSLICKESGNGALESFSAIFRATGRPYGFTGEGLSELLAASHKQHRQIVEGILNRDPLAAAGAASAHVRETMTLLKKHQPSIQRGANSA